MFREPKPGESLRDFVISRISDPGCYWGQDEDGNPMLDEIREEPNLEYFEDLGEPVEGFRVGKDPVVWLALVLDGHVDNIDTGDGASLEYDLNA